jgi:hypothetical protein
MFNAVVAGPIGLGGLTAFSRAPLWLDAAAFVQASTTMLSPDPKGSGVGPFLAVAVPPRLGVCGVNYRTDTTGPLSYYVGKWVRLSGHFDDPAAITCRVTHDYPRNGGPVPSTKQVVDICRRVFVLSSVARF